MKKIIFTLIVLSFALTFTVVGFAQDDGYAVIANKANSTDSFSARDLKQIFLGKKTTWPDSKKIVVGVLKKGPVHKKFLKEIVKKNVKQFSTFWVKATFTGTGDPPKSFSTDAELKDFVKANPTAIGYIPQSLMDDTIKKIEVK